MLSRVWRFVRDQRLLAPKDGVLVACSAGPDSTALLDVLLRLRDRLGLGLRVAYVHHGLRPEADEEAEYMREKAHSLGLPFDVLRVRVPRQASLQEAARTVRLDALAELARKKGLARVALGHTRTDQAETVLMRVIRGTGPRGLAGIPPRRGRFVRPLLCVGRAEIENYLEQRGLSCLADASNADRRFLRVRVRLDVMPRLRELNPKIEESLARLSANARDERDGFASPPLSRAHLRGLASILEKPGGTRWLSLPGGRLAEVRVVQARRSPLPQSVEVSVPGPGRYRVPALEATFVLRRDRQAPGDASGWFDAAALRFPLVLRTRRPGDRIRLQRGRKKVSELLIDAKVPRRDRDGVLLLCAGERVLWVADVRQAAGTRPTGRGGFLATIVRTSVDPVAMPTNNEARQCDPP